MVTLQLCSNRGGLNVEHLYRIYEKIDQQTKKIENHGNIITRAIRNFLTKGKYKTQKQLGLMKLKQLRKDVEEKAKAEVGEAAEAKSHEVLAEIDEGVDSDIDEIKGELKNVGMKL